MEPEPGDHWLEVIRWVDTWPDMLAIDRQPIVGKFGFWPLIRIDLIERAAALIPDFLVFDRFVAATGPSVVRLENASPHWAAVARLVGEARDVLVDVARPPFDLARRRRSAEKAVLIGRRTLVGFQRQLRSSPKRDGGVISLGYSTMRRITVGGVTQFLDPNFSPVLDEIDRRKIPHWRLNLPTPYNPGQERLWLEAGDRKATPIELPYLQWVIRGRPERLVIDPAEITRDIVASLEGKRLSFRGHNLGFAARELLLHGVAALRRRAQQVAFFRWLFARVHPDAVLLTSEYSGAALAARIAAGSLGVPTIAVQHGVIWRGHPGYVVGSSRPNLAGHPDRLCVFGDYERRLLVQSGSFTEQQVVVTGSPRLDLARPAEATIREALVRSLAHEAIGTIVLFTSAGVQAEATADALMRFASPESDGMLLLVKLHPTYPQERDAYRAAALRYQFRRIAIVEEDFDLYQLLTAVDVHMSTNSTVLTEAVVFDRPNIVLAPSLFSDTVGYIRRGVAVSSENYSSLAQAARDVLQGDTARALLEARAAFVRDHFHSLDGCASKRAVDAVEQTVRQGLASEHLPPTRTHP